MIKYTLIIALIILAFFLLPRPTPWFTLAKEDLQASLTLLKSYHPAFVDTEEEHFAFKKWLTEGYQQSLQMAKNKPSMQGYAFSLTHYISGFKDGHLKLQTIETDNIYWPEFFLVYHEGKYYVSSSMQERLPNDTQVIACNGKDPSSLMLSNIFPFVSDAPSVASSWTKLTPYLLIDQENPFIEKINNITYLDGNEKHSLVLSFRKINRETLNEKIEKTLFFTTPEFSIQEFGERGIWLSIPTFNPDRKGADLALPRLIEQLPNLRDKDPIVFDVRGNGGGSSRWIAPILTSLYGEEYLNGLPHIKNAQTFADDRLIKELIEKSQQKGPYFEKIKDAYERGAPFLRRKIDLFPLSKGAGPRRDNPVKGNVFLLTDERCFSACLIFADALLSIPGVQHVGRTTMADTKFSQPISFPLPSGLSTLMIPYTIRRQWERKDNEPYVPKHKYLGPLNEEKLKEWILNLSL